MNPQFAQLVLLALVASAPGLLALYLRYRRDAQLRVESDKAHVQRELLAQLQEQIISQQKTIRFLVRRVDELETARAQEFADTEALRQENEGLREEIREVRRGVAELIRQMDAAKLTPAWKPTPKPAATEKRPVKGGDQAALRKKIVAAFSLREIADLAFELDVDPDEVPGETATDRARSLVSYLQDRGRLSELAALCRDKRPNGGF